MVPGLSAGLMVLAGAANAVMDLTKSKSMWSRSTWSKLPANHWWTKWAGPDSWKNKWKLDKDGKTTSSDRFFMSSTVFVFITDAWHFFQMLWSTLFILAALMYMPIWGWGGIPVFLVYVVEFIVLKAAYTGTFVLLFDYIFKKKADEK